MTNTKTGWEKVKTFGDFIDELLCKQNNPYEPVKDAKPYYRYRNLCALVNNEMNEKMKGNRFYEENKRELWKVMENTIAATLYIQTQIKDKSSELADARREGHEEGYVKGQKEAKRKNNNAYEYGKSDARREVITGETSDGYHTFNELYEFRKLFNALLFNEWAKQGLYDVHKSTRHFDGEECFGGGWFIVMAETPKGQISNHYEMKDWDLFKIPTKDKANKWDGHTAQDVLKTLSVLATLKEEKI